MRFLPILLLITSLGCGVAVEGPGINPDATLGRTDAGSGRDAAGNNGNGGHDTGDGYDAGQAAGADVEQPPSPADTGRPVDPPVRQDDHGDWVDDATDAPLGSSSVGTINYAGDEDFFRFTTTLAGRYSAYTEGRIDTFCVLLSIAGRPLFENDDGGEGSNCKITEDLQGQTTYAVNVRHFDPEARGNYTFHVTGPVGGLESVCGNARVEAGEQCDDGNQRNGDGCNDRCQWEQDPDQLPAGCNEIGGRQRTTALCWQPRNRADAVSHCQTVGMTLATIDNERDNQILLDASNRFSPWIGLSDLAEENIWVWQGRTSQYTNWGRGEPNDWGNGEDCVQMTTNGQWNDAGCASLVAFFCEAPRD
jgi:cysteine-rich repeat protein